MSSRFMANPAQSWKFAPQPKSSTEFRARATRRSPGHRRGGFTTPAQQREAAVITMDFSAFGNRLQQCLSCHPATERNESVSARADSISDSNRKDKRIAHRGLLLTAANACRMEMFADDDCQHSSLADEQVMDRGAERVARGCDAV